MVRANSFGWDIQTLVSSVSASTADTFRESGFVELGRLDIFRDTQIALGWSRFRGQETRKRAPALDEDPVVQKPVSKRSRTVSLGEKD
jgi:hypothetical protein